MKKDELRSYEQELTNTYNLDHVIKHESETEDNLLFAIDAVKGVFILNKEIHPLDWMKSVEYLTISAPTNDDEANRDIALASLFTGGLFATGSGVVSMGSKGPNTSEDCMEGRLIRGLVIRPKNTKENNLTVFANEDFCKEVYRVLQK